MDCVTLQFCGTFPCKNDLENSAAGQLNNLAAFGAAYRMFHQKSLLVIDLPRIFISGQSNNKGMSKIDCVRFNKEKKLDGKNVQNRGMN